MVTIGIIGFNYYNDTYKSQEYFAKVTKLVPQTPELDMDGKKMGKIYEYSLTAYSAEGVARKIDLPWRGDKPIPVGTWLKVNASKTRVTSQSTITHEDVPKAAQDKY